MNNAEDGPSSWTIISLTPMPSTLTGQASCVPLQEKSPLLSVIFISLAGYFTSRPSLKFAIKKGANLLQASNQLNVLALKGLSHAQSFQEMKETMGILQHHDAVTGTCKQFVNDDYQK